MANGTSFEIDIDARADSAETAAAKVDLLAQRLAAAGEASTAASDAVKAAEAAYRQTEASADRAAKALEKINLAVAAQQDKVQLAIDSGDVEAAESLSVKLNKLKDRQAEAAAKATELTNAMTKEAAALDAAKAAADRAAGEYEQLSKAHEQANKTAAAMAKAAAAAKGSGNFGNLANGAKKLGGPLGRVADVAGDASEGFEQLTASLGTSGGAMAAAALGAVAVAAAVIAIGAAAAVGLGKATLWAVRLADKNKDIDKQTTRLTSNIDKLFGGLKINGLVAGLSKVVDLFDETSVTGKAIKVVFESLFQPIVDGLASLAPMIVKTFIQFEIWVLKALIAIKPFGSTIVLVAKVIGVAILAVAAVFGVLLAALVVGSAAFGALIGTIVWLSLKFAELLGDIGRFAAAIVKDPSAAIDWLVAKFQSILDFLSGLSLGEIGVQLVQGLANGIMNGGAAVLSAITGVVDGAIGAAKSLLGIASPSKVFAEIGGYTAEGMAGGVEGGTARVQGSLEAMVAPPTDAGAASASGGAGGGNTFEIVIQAGGGDAPSIATAVREVILDIFEGNARQLGTEVPA